MYRTVNLFDWRSNAPVWDTPGEGAGASATPPAGDGAPAGGGEGSPAGEAEGGQSGDTPSTGNLVTDGSTTAGNGASGEGGEAFTPLAATDIELPEGVEVSEADMNSFLGIMNNRELTPAQQGQQLVALQLEMAQNAQDAATQAGQTLWEETQNNWRAEAQALPEIGGDQLDRTLADIKKGLQVAGADDATFEALNVTGAGNHPAIIKLLHKLTEPLVEKTPVHGDATGGSPKLSHAQILFGGQSQE